MGLGADLLVALGRDARRYGPGAAALHLLRGLRADPALHRALGASPSLRAHQAALGGRDPLFYLAHRRYLAGGLGPRERALAALAHYRHEDGAPEPYRAAARGPGGLVLWSAAAGEVAWDIRLTPGQDVMNEGGLSVVLHADGARVCVLSLSWVPAALVGAAEAAGPGGLVPFVTRRQQTRERAWQAAFNAAFDRAMPAHLCLGALSGLCLARGFGAALLIAAERHPVWEPAQAEHLHAAYDAFWARSLGSRRRSGGSLGCRCGSGRSRRSTRGGASGR